MDILKDKNILVTGGTGFVGSHLVEELVNSGANVVTTYKTISPKSYFVSQNLADKTTLVPLDIVEFEKVFDVVTKLEIDFIFHLAAQPLVETAFYNPRRTFDSNIRGTINILESARLYPRVKGVIFASSDKAYGKHGETKYVEGDSLQGDHPYEVSKSAADLIATSYVKTYNLPVVITRFGNIYGEGDLNYSRIIPGIMKSVIQNEKLDIRSNGKYIRDYLYVKDVVSGYILLAENIAKVKGEVFNFGSDETLSVLDVIKTCEKYLGKKISYKILNKAKNEIPYQSLNYSKIKKTLKWYPKYSLKTTTDRMYSWYSKAL